MRYELDLRAHAFDRSPATNRLQLIDRGLVSGVDCFRTLTVPIQTQPARGLIGVIERNHTDPALFGERRTA
jgi:hypothetical protein